MRTIFVICYIAFTSVCFGQSLQVVYADGKAAYKQKNFNLFYEKMGEAHKLHPYHQDVLYQLGIASALTGHTDEAIENLKKAVLINSDYRLDVSDLSSLESNPKFNELKRLQEEWKKPIVNSDTFLIIKERDLHAEGIGYDAKSKNLYVGSIHKRKILQVSEDGSARDFCPSEIEGMTSVFGVKLDQKAGVLWACASPMPEMMHYDSLSPSAVFKFELRNGKLLQKHVLSGSKPAVFGDMVLSKSGSVYVSDSKNNEIFLVGPNGITSFFSTPEFWNIQGMAFSADEKYLFVADYVKGIFRLEMESKKLLLLTTEQDVSLKGIDGLYFLDNSLIAVQNGTNPLRCTQYFLDKGQTKIMAFKILDRKHPSFGEPTTGVLAGKTFYYIANSQWDGYKDDHSIKPYNELKDIVILRRKLD